MKKFELIDLIVIVIWLIIHILFLYDHLNIADVATITITSAKMSMQLVHII
jgi:hypothetical protein